MPRRDRLVQEYKHDPYFVQAKYKEPSVCKECGVTFHDGKFEWQKTPPENAHEIVCPACRRCQDNYEGGVVYLEGGFLAQHADEIGNLIDNTAELETQNRPLERIMDRQTLEDGSLTVRTTYEHLARRIGEAVHKAYEGELDFRYPSGEKYIRVHWCRD